MALKTSKVSDLLESLANTMLIELQQSTDKDGIPLSASDKAVILALIRHCGVTAEPDSDALEGLKQAYSDDLATRREARAKTLTNTLRDEGLDGLMN